MSSTPAPDVVHGGPRVPDVPPPWKKPLNVQWGQGSLARGRGRDDGRSTGTRSTTGNEGLPSCYGGGPSCTHSSSLHRCPVSNRITTINNCIVMLIILRRNY